MIFLFAQSFGEGESEIGNSETLPPPSSKTRAGIAGSSGTAFRKRKLSSLPIPLASTETMDMVQKGMKRALEVMARPKDDARIFGEFVASQLRRVEVTGDAHRIERKIQKIFFDYFEEQDARPSSSASSHFSQFSSPSQFRPIENDTQLDTMEVIVDTELPAGTMQILDANGKPLYQVVSNFVQNDVSLENANSE